MRWIIAAAPFVLAACGEMTPAEEEAAREAAVAEVEANQEPPPELLKLDPIRFADIEKYNLYGAGCNFSPDGDASAPVALAQADAGYLIRRGELQKLASDKGSAEKPYMSYRKYDGLEYSFTLDFDEANGRQSGYETMDYDGTLTVRDGSDNVLYTAKGLVQCGA